MCIKINLYFKKTIDLELLEKEVGIKLIRVIRQARFKTKDAWTDLYPVIIDTGAPVSVLPKRIWNKAEVRKLTGHSLRSIIKVLSLKRSVICP
jgi:hypothetical protein